MRGYPPPEVLAFSRTAIESTFVDTCVFLRPYVPVPTGPTPSTGASDGRGGSTGGRGQTGVDHEGFKRDSSSVACRLEYMPPKKGSAEEVAGGGVEEKTMAMLAIPVTTVVSDRDRVEVTERASGKVSLWEVTYQAPCTDSYSLQIAIARIGTGRAEP